MNRILTTNHILHVVSVFTILLLTSCEHKDLCYDHSDATEIQVVFDWTNAPDATPETMRLYLFPVGGGTPHTYEFPDYRGVVLTYLQAVTRPFVSTPIRSPYFTAILTRLTVSRLTLRTVS